MSSLPLVELILFIAEIQITDEGLNSISTLLQKNLAMEIINLRLGGIIVSESAFINLINSISLQAFLSVLQLEYQKATDKSGEILVNLIAKSTRLTVFYLDVERCFSYPIGQEFQEAL
eukprot:TRINITY_DN17419_c0_g1_i1.p1 TRINITY_DN17419_c0_g1~~TRINITY_DN17419_c0_g1_i1.p1  ORF type:complete len:118 (+),score=0.91 TRINITY_DN17419_c0_g1_i1:145-498(+)